MKIVGRTDDGYLAQITVEEIGVITGFGKYPMYGRDEDKARFARAIGTKTVHEKIPTHTIIDIIVGVDYIAKVRGKIKTAKKTASELRELADMLDNAIPAIIIPPSEEPNA